MSKPKPTGPDPRAGQLPPNLRSGQFQFVVSFRAGPMTCHMDHWLGDLRESLRVWGTDHSDGLGSLDIAIREIGSQGETSRDEGRWDAPRKGHQDGPGRPQGVNG